MVHGFLLDGDRSVEAIAVTARVIMNQTADFLGKFVSPTFFNYESVMSFYYQSDALQRGAGSYQHRPRFGTEFEGL